MRSSFDKIAGSDFGRRSRPKGAIQGCIASILVRNEKARSKRAFLFCLGDSLTAPSSSRQNRRQSTVYPPAGEKKFPQQARRVIDSAVFPFRADC